MSDVILLILIFIGVTISTITHELGHYILAKKKGIYKRWGILPQPHIKMTKPHTRTSHYLFGMAFSFVSLPFWIVINMLVVGVLCIVLLSSIDLIFYLVLTVKGIKNPREWLEREKKK